MAPWRCPQSRQCQFVTCVPANNPQPLGETDLQGTTRRLGRLVEQVQGVGQNLLLELLSHQIGGRIPTDPSIHGRRPRPPAGVPGDLTLNVTMTGTEDAFLNHWAVLSQHLATQCAVPVTGAGICINEVNRQTAQVREAVGEPPDQIVRAIGHHQP